MANGLRDLHILDTSAWNRLLDDARREQIIEKLNAVTVLPTSVAIVESGATPSTGRRRKLIRLMRRFRQYRPLSMPNQIIILACKGFSRRDRNMSFNAGTEADGAWIALNYPDLVNEEAQRIALQSNMEREESFRKIFEGLRKELEPLFLNRATRPRSFKALVQVYTAREDSLYEFVNSIYMQAVGAALPRSQLQELINSLPHWRMFLLSYVHAVYGRAVKEFEYGHKRNPGNLDLWSAVYLCCCSVFVTHDKPQRRALKIINRLNQKPCRVLSYAEWSEEVLAG